jgi:hypothetical protein
MSHASTFLPEWLWYKLWPAWFLPRRMSKLHSKWASIKFLWTSRSSPCFSYKARFADVKFLTKHRKVVRNTNLTLISGFRRDVDEICALLRYYATSCGNCLPTFRDNGSVPSSGVKKSYLQDSRRPRLPDPWRWDRYFVPKRQQTITTRSRVISQKSADLKFNLNVRNRKKWIKWSVPGRVQCSSVLTTWLLVKFV